MEKKKNKVLLYILIIFILTIFIIAGYKNLKNHRDKEYQVLYSEILEKAKECYQKNECTDKISLKDLYDKNFLDYKYDPISKEKLDDNLCIYYENYEAKFCK